MDDARLHPDCAAVAFLVGRWQGTGRGGYPTLEAFRYVEELTVSQWGKAYLSIEQRTWLSDADGKRLRPSHAESGYLRCHPGGELELLVATGPGQAESSAGRVADGRIELASVGVLSAASASRVRRTKRTWWLEGEMLRYEFEMEAVDQPLGWHLSSELHRTND